MSPFPWSLAEIETLAGSGKLTPRRMLRASRDAIDAMEPGIRAWAFLDLAGARDRAAWVSRTRPLHGVPYGAKDIFDTAGMPTEWGSPAQRGRRPASDCDLVARLDSLGAVLLGKTCTTAYAYFDPAPTRNPRNLAHTPGGSSSGSAAAVAAGMVPLAIGSQTQGSVVRPASFCGVAGFKPSFGLLPLRGVMPFAPTLDHAGLFAADARDIRVAWRALGYRDDAVVTDTITVVDWPPGSGVAPSMDAAFRSAVRSLSAQGVRVERAARPPFFDTLPDAVRTVMAWEAAREHWEHYLSFGAAVGTRMADLLEEGRRIPDASYRRALGTLRQARTEFALWSSHRPVIATPAAPGPAPAGLGSTGDPRCNAPFTALGVPAISIPMLVPKGDLPLGLQLSGRAGEDACLLATAAACERVLRPPCR